MSDDKYTYLDGLAGFGFLVTAMSGGGDKGQSFPRSDAEDLSRGLRFIPGEVTIARRRGDHVHFVQACPCRCCWYWQFPDGSRTYYWDRASYERLDGKSCPTCGNINIRGGFIQGPFEEPRE